MELDGDPGLLGPALHEGGHVLVPRQGLDISSKPQTDGADEGGLAAPRQETLDIETDMACPLTHYDQ